MSSVIANLRVMLSADSAQLRTALGRTERQTKRWAKKTTGSVRQVQSSFLALGGVLASTFTAAPIIQRADEMILLESRMLAVTGSANKTAIAMGNIKKVANESRSDIKATGELYTKMAIATSHLGLEQEKISKLSQTVLDTFLLSGTSASEAANSARQFAQGLASGRIQGDELRSVMENNIYLAQLLAEGFGVTTGQLKEMGAQGELTAEKLISVLGNSFDRTRKKAGDMRLTFGQAMTQLSNKFTILIEKIEKKTGFIDKLTGAIAWLDKNMVHLAWAGTFLFGGMLVGLGILLGGFLISLSPVTLAIMGIIGAMGAAAYWGSKHAATLQKVFHKVFKVAIPQMFLKLKAAFYNMTIAMMNGWNYLVVNMAIGVNKLIDQWNKIPDFLRPGAKVEPVTFKGIRADTTGLEQLVEQAKAASDALDRLHENFVQIVDNRNAHKGDEESGPAAADGPLTGWEDAIARLKGMWSDFSSTMYEDFNLISISAETSWEAILKAASKNSKKLMALRKSMAVGKVIMDTANAVMSVWADSTLPFWSKVGATATVAAAGVTNLATIRGQAHDGIDNVPSTGTYLLEKGERVVDARLNKDLTSVLKGGGSMGGSSNITFAVTGVEDPDVINKVIQQNRGKFESMIRDIYTDSAQNAPF